MGSAIREDEREMRERTGLSRRGFMSAAAGGFALAGNELVLPDWLEAEAEAREGALGGELGGRRGEDRRGRDKAQRDRRRGRHDKKNDAKDNDGPPPGGGLFRSAALTVRSFTDPLFTYTFFYRIKTGLDDYGPWLASHAETPGAGASYRYAPGRFRVGVLVSAPSAAGEGQVFIDVRNLSFGVPRGSGRYGAGLDPVHNGLGTTLFTEQAFTAMSVPVSGFYAVGDTVDALIDVRRVTDSEDAIEFQVIVSTRSEP
jgi:hypothetical protein